MRCSAVYIRAPLDMSSLPIVYYVSCLSMAYLMPCPLWGRNQAHLYS